MANYTAADVKKLRDATGAGMMDAKKALETTDGDFEKAIEELRIHGAAKAAKRGAERSASNGLVAAAENALVQLNCETDFVPRTSSSSSSPPTSSRTPPPARSATSRAC